MNTTIITVDQAIADSNYKWSKGDNDIDYLGWIPGYSVGVCMEIKRYDGSIGYSSCTFVNNEEDLKVIKENDIHSLDKLSIMADLCSHSGSPTGRLVFRGYFEEEWDYEEREYGYYERSKEVLDLYKKYNVEGI